MIKTIKIFLITIAFSALFALFLVSVPLYIISTLLILGAFSFIFYLIYSTTSYQMEWEEEMKKREHIWKKIDEKKTKND